MSSKSFKLFESKLIQFVLKSVGFYPEECKLNPGYSWLKSFFAAFVTFSIFIMEIIGMILYATSETMAV